MSIKYFSGCRSNDDTRFEKGFSLTAATNEEMACDASEKVTATTQNLEGIQHLNEYFSKYCMV